MAGAAIIAKAILGSIGGGLEGAAKPYTNGDAGTKAVSTGAEKVGSTEDGKKEVVIKTDALNNQNLTDESNLKKAESMDFKKAQDAFKTDGSKAFGMKANFGELFNSDERLKEIYGDSISDRIIEDFAKISAIDFRYTPEAQKEYQGLNGVDDEKHTGVIAQELAATESTESAVNPDEKGNLVVDTKQLTMSNTAAIAELSRRVLTLETAIKELMGKGE